MIGSWNGRAVRIHSRPFVNAANQRRARPALANVLAQICADLGERTIDRTGQAAHAGDGCKGNQCEYQYVLDEALSVFLTPQANQRIQNQVLHWLPLNLNLNVSKPPRFHEPKLLDEYTPPIAPERLSARFWNTCAE